ncbi:MAG: Type 1 glutamine amidotransferase-like domain-containing protein [Clostridia bacterium]|nr:Type 1 glutamine amidotransferase-like domain-containing protein [Clostridia bacterium]
MITAFPDDPSANDEMRAFFEDALRRSGLPLQCLDLWDRRFPLISREALHAYPVILLGGGHVPTQHAFFEQIGLRAKLKGYNGLIIGISAGSMNAADIVYAQPELPGESTNPGYIRFFEGLGLTRTNILPHYQMVRNSILDGRRLFEDITYPDSHNRQFLILPDGSYLLSENSRETVFGEAYLLSNGMLSRICSENQSCLL